MTDREQICKRIAELEKFIRTESNRLELIKSNYSRRLSAGTDPDLLKRVESDMDPRLAIGFYDMIAFTSQRISDAYQEVFELRKSISGDIEKVEKDNAREMLIYRYIYGLTLKETTEKLFYADSRSVSRVCTQFMRYQI